MRGFACGVVVCGLVCFLLSGVNTSQTNAAPGQPDFESGLCIVPMPGGDGDTMHEVVVLDGRNRRIGVYQVDRQSGKIGLTSVRNINWDLQLDAFNEKSPGPNEVRAMLER